MITTEIDYNDCLNYIENILKIKLFDFQKTILKTWCEDKDVIPTGLLTEDMVKKAENLMSEEHFKRVYLCK